jgi:hypothetical protein
MTRVSAANGTGEASWSKPPDARTSVEMDMKALRVKGAVVEMACTNMILPRVTRHGGNIE